MMTSWNETQQIETYLQGSAEPTEQLLFNARLLLDNALADKVIAQRKTYTVIQQYGRQQLKQEIEAVQQILFTSPKHNRFRDKIKRLFKKS